MTAMDNTKYEEPKVAVLGTLAELTQANTGIGAARVLALAKAQYAPMA